MLIIEQGDLAEDIENSHSQVLDFELNSKAIEYLHKAMKQLLDSGYVIHVTEAENDNQVDSVESYRSARGILNNLTAQDSNSASNKEMEGSVLGKRDFVKGEANVADFTKKQLKTVKSARKSPKQQDFAEKGNKSLDKDGAMEVEEGLPKIDKK